MQFFPPNTTPQYNPHFKSAIRHLGCGLWFCLMPGSLSSKPILWANYSSGSTIQYMGVDCGRWVANECRNVWQPAGLLNPEASTVFLTAFWITLLPRWCRPWVPVCRFLQRYCWGKTHCDTRSCAAEAYFLDRASGSNTLPHPSEHISIMASSILNPVP